MPESSERELNPRLRRADWRFLLPSPRPKRALCIAGGDLTEAVASIADEVILAGAAGDCDLAVAETPDPLGLTALRDALRPGGVCYTEWRLLIGGAGRVERKLRAAGFVDVTCYRPWPVSATLPVYWIPLGAPGAAAYVRSRARLRGGRVRRLLTGLRHGARELFRGRSAGAICAIARRPGDPDGLPCPAAWLRRDWLKWGVGPVPERLSTLLVTGGPRSISKAVLLAFAEPSPVPRVAVKAPRVDAASAGIRREGTVLAGLAERRSEYVPGVPRLLFCRETNGVPLVGETALAGRPLETLLSRRSLGTWSQKVTDWLAALANGVPPRPAVHWHETVVEPTLSWFVDRFGEVADRGLLRESEGILREIGVMSPVPEQRDFGPWNLLVTPTGQLAVLDWESAEVDGLPALDLLYYLAYASFNVERAHDVESRVASYRRSLLPSTPTGAVRRECLARYLAALHLAPASLAPLRVLVWLIHARSDYRHAAADSGGQPPSTVLARSLFLGLWAEEVRHVARG